MTRFEALKIDISFYADYCDITDCWCVFGSETGFAYECCSSRLEAESLANSYMPA